jgi:hypothetical protein
MIPLLKFSGIGYAGECARLPVFPSLDDSKPPAGWDQSAQRGTFHLMIAFF